MPAGSAARSRFTHATGIPMRWAPTTSMSARSPTNSASDGATCDGFFFRDQDIMVVGGGDSAIEEALYLARLGRQVAVVHRRDTLRASKIMVDRATQNPKIRFIWDSAVEEI